MGAKAARAEAEKAHAAELIEVRAKSVVEYRESDDFIALVDKEVME